MNAMILSIISQIPEEDPAVWPWHIVAAVLGIILGWGLNSWKTHSEIQKLKKEIQKFESEIKKLDIEQVKLAGESLEKYQSARKAYSDECLECGLFAKSVLEALKQNQNANAAESREELCRTLAHGVIPGLCALTEWDALNYSSEIADLSEIIREDTIPELARIQNWIQIINLPVFIQGMSLSELKIQRRSLRPLLNIGKTLDSNQCTECKEDLSIAIDEIVE
ncbi:MAG: hypothetical protein KAW14_03535 [Candidatus Aegiribacteria sp.]|nr:hypothetical protein [Candidatus Aegiribacteria sp.]